MSAGFMDAPLMAVCEGDETVIRDKHDAVILTVQWDGKEAGEGGVNDVLFSLVDAYNGAVAES